MKLESLIACKFEIVQDCFRKHPDSILSLPYKATSYSAGYDFFVPQETIIEPKETKIIWTDIKAFMLENLFLLICLRSSVGIKRNVMLANSVGIIDSDYYNNPTNDGNIGFAIRNLGEIPTVFQEGERIGQGIFLPFISTALNPLQDSFEQERMGGFGSTSNL